MDGTRQRRTQYASPPGRLELSRIRPLVQRVLNWRVLRPSRLDVVVFGESFWDWTLNLGPQAPVWRRLGAVGSVVLAADDWRAPSLPWLAARGRLVIPLLECNIEAMAPVDCWGLFPSRRAVEILADKAKFERYAVRRGLAHLVPPSFGSPAEVTYPCVVKRTNLQGGHGVAVAETPQELATHLAAEGIAGHPVVLQRLLEGPDITVHAVVVAGRLRWHRAYEHVYDRAKPIHRPGPDEPTRTVRLSQRDIEDLESFLVPLSYEGPVNFDMKRGGDGRVRVLEINPRIGGSLFRAHNLDDLTAALMTLIRYARWHGGLRGLRGRAPGAGHPTATTA